MKYFWLVYYSFYLSSILIRQRHLSLRRRDPSRTAKPSLDWTISKFLSVNMRPLLPSYQLLQVPQKVCYQKSGAFSSNHFSSQRLAYLHLFFILKSYLYLKLQDLSFHLTLLGSDNSSLNASCTLTLMSLSSLPINWTHKIFDLSLLPRSIQSLVCMLPSWAHSC